MARTLPAAVRRAAVALLPAAVGVVGAWLGMLAWGAQTVPVGPFRVQLEAGLGRGVTDIALPPLGRITADTHLAPLRLRATLVDVDAQRLARALAARSTEDLVAGMEVEALDRLGPYALRLLGVALAGAAALGVAVFRRRLRPAGVALVAALVVVGGSEALTVATYRPDAFLSPTFSGSLAAAPRLIGPVRAAGERIGYFRTELERIVDGALRAYRSIQANPLGSEDVIAVLHVSDMHLSTLGFEFARQVAEGFDVDLVVDTGDITSFGTAAEEFVLRFIPPFGRPYVFVRGNHDSVEVQQALGRVPNAIVLDGRAVEVAGLTIYGLGDPYFVEERGQPLEDREIAELVRSAGPRIAADLAELPRPPDLVAVHDERMAEAVFGLVPVVVSGHFHEAGARVVDGTIALRVGTTGGAGPTGFTAEGDVPLSAEVLYFAPPAGTEPARLLAWDVVEQFPDTGSLTVTRHVVEREFGEPVLTPPPSPTPTA
ncbi:MAG TPA: metallophosphoesterase [Actinomycetota bacterium]|nr:metallophosphoesterase [Actinomycetota bacterium]